MNIIRTRQETDLEGITEYKVEETDLTRTRILFTLIPIWINRFSWFQRINVLERLCIVTKKEFNDGWSYMHHWGKPKEVWLKEKIID